METNILVKKNWEKAAISYNKSLCFAEPGTENIALAYSNRSACFFKVKMFDKVLVDIDLAIKAKIPDRLLPKLKQRREYALKMILVMTGGLPNSTPQLSYKADKNIMSMANVIKIEHNEEYGRHLVAKSDIPKGKVVLMEKNFQISDYPWYCYTCSKQSMNCIACISCPDVIFCDTNCMNNDQIHKFECGTFFPNLPLSIRFQIKTILFAISSFPNVKSLIQFVESALLENREILPKSLNDSKSEYLFFFKLSTSVPYAQGPVEAFKAYEYTINLPIVCDLFDTTQKKRFLMHLTMHHTLISRSNAFGDEQLMYVNKVFSLLNHACINNIKTTIIKGHMIGETAVAIKKDEQLFINYSKRLIGMEKNERKEKCMTNWGFLCKCKICK